MATIWIIGDSTVENNTPPFRGWGWAIPEYVKQGISVCNHALSGTSTKSFWNQQLFVPVETGMKKGDLLLIQFGHNDEKDDEERHTDPDTAFTDNLKRYCDIALSKGTQPVLLTPVSRRFFVGENSLLYTHGEYPRAVRQLAEKENIPICDLKMLSRQLYLTLGDELTAKLFVHIEKGENQDFPDGHDDKTHFNATGAVIIARLVAESLRNDPRCKFAFR